MKQLTTLLAALLLSIGAMNAQLNQNPCKFLGNITTSGRIQPNAGGIKYEDLWDQLTCENETKWGSIVNCKVSSAQEGVQKWNWSAADSHYQWCKQNGVQFKFHALIWTSQWPHKLRDCTPAELKEQVGYWFDAIAIKYPDLTVIDVVNEALKGHAEGNDGNDPNYPSLSFKKLLSKALGNSDDPYDYKWIAEAFRMARKRFPNAVLIYNDYNTFTWNKNDFVDLVASLVKQGAPIDAYGHQSHDLDEYYDNGSNKWGGIASFGKTFKQIHDAITQKGGRELQCYVTEYDIDQSDDTKYETILKNTFAPMWESDFLSGMTLWGYITGRTWRSNSGLYTNSGAERSGIKWLRNYMATDAAKNAKAKFCGKDAGVGLSLKVSSPKVLLGESIKISADMPNVKHVNFTANGSEINDKWMSPFEFDWTPVAAGTYEIVAVGENSKGEKATAKVVVKVLTTGPYKGVAHAIPGTIQAEDYDEGGEGVGYSDKSTGNSCDNFTDYYRSDDVDIKQITGGAALGNCQSGEWLDYTVNVEEDGLYDVAIRAGEGNTNGKLSLSLGGQTNEVLVDKTGEWGSFEEVKAGTMELSKGQAILRLSIDQDWIDIDWIKFEKVTSTGVEDAAAVSIALAPNPASSLVEVYGVMPTCLEVVSMQGVVLKKCEGNVISVDDLQNGNYLVRIVSDDCVTVKQLVVRK